MSKVLWVLQVLLALVFLMAGGMKLVTPIADILAQGPQMAWAGDMPVIVVRFIGLVEVLGAIGLILPAITRIQPDFNSMGSHWFGYRNGWGSHSSCHSWGIRFYHAQFHLATLVCICRIRPF